MQDNLVNCSQGNKAAIDMAAANYLGFLTEGRKVILEDAAILQDRYPEHRLFKMSCFRLPVDDRAMTPLQQKWVDYKAEVIAAHGRTIDENMQVTH